jgi:murein DD-endopeptidase MepM/ murein hydrolase activator NlpD
VGKIIKYLKRKCGNGFTFLVVPNSSGSVKSLTIPFSVALVVAAIILFNIYIFGGFTTQIFRIYNYKQDIKQKKTEITKLRHEQKEVKPALNKSFKIADQLNDLQKERVQILSHWKAIQQKGGRSVTQTSRGSVVRVNPYIINEIKTKELKTELDDLKNNLNYLTEFVKEESDAQHQLLSELLAYERRLDHTPSIWPVRSHVINSFFGRRVHPILGYSREHTGLDLQASYGTKVVAAADGVVSFSGYRGGYGYTVIINHEYGYQTLYGHNSQLLVYVGKVVKKGQIISLSGNSGTSTGPHLHYEVHVNGQPINPVSFLKN